MNDLNIHDYYYYCYIYIYIDTCLAHAQRFDPPLLDRTHKEEKKTI